MKLFRKTTSLLLASVPLLMGSTAAAQQLPALPGYPMAVSRCGSQLEPVVTNDCINGGYRSFFTESGGSTGGYDIWSHSMAAGVVHRRSSTLESMHPAADQAVVWADSSSSQSSIIREFDDFVIAAGNFPDVVSLGCCKTIIVWQVRNPSGDFDIALRVISDGAQSTTFLTQTASRDETKPVISVSEDSVYVAWQGVDHPSPVDPDPSSSVEYAELDFHGNILNSGILPSNSRMSNPAIGGTVVCYEAWVYPSMKRIACRDLEVAASLSDPDEANFTLTMDPRRIRPIRPRAIRPRVGSNGRHVLFMAKNNVSNKTDPAEPSVKSLMLFDRSTELLYVVENEFGNGIGDCLLFPSSCNPLDPSYLFDDDSDAFNTRYDIESNMIIYSNENSETAKSCILSGQYPADYRDVDIFYYQFDESAL